MINNGACCMALLSTRKLHNLEGAGWDFQWRIHDFPMQGRRYILVNLCLHLPICRFWKFAIKAGASLSQFLMKNNQKVNLTNHLRIPHPSQPTHSCHYLSCQPYRNLNKFWLIIKNMAQAYCDKKYLKLFDYKPKWRPIHTDRVCVSVSICDMAGKWVPLISMVLFTLSYAKYERKSRKRNRSLWMSL